MARPKRFERSTPAFGGQYSIQLSYGRKVTKHNDFFTYRLVAGFGNFLIWRYNCRLYFDCQGNIMSSHDEKMEKTTLGQFLAALVGSLVPVLIVAYLIAQHVVGYASTNSSKEDPAVASKLVAERIKPIGEVGEGPAVGAAKVEKSGEEVFNAVCTACHTPGAAGAPKIGDKGAWGPRIAQGFDTLVKHATGGFTGKAGMMPAKGGASDLSDDEVARAVAYMANKGGASFKAPEAKAPAAATPAPAAAAGGADKGKATFEGTCVACHGAGVAGAPKAGDKAAWGPRIAQGKDTLYKHALGGFTGKAGMMPAKGGNAGLADEDVKAAVDHMVGMAK
jgi:cytochrome c5